MVADKKVAIGFEGLNFGMGMGLRAAMPKLPSFRVNINWFLSYQSYRYFCMLSVYPFYDVIIRKRTLGRSYRSIDLFNFTIFIDFIYNI